MKFSLFIFFLFVFSSINLAQQTTSFKIDEFTGDINAEGLIARLEGISLHLHNDPDINLSFAVFRAKSDSLGFPYRYIAKINAYLEKHRGLEPQRVKASFCGTSIERKLVFYIQPKTATRSLCTNFEKLNLKRTFLFDLLDNTVDGCICCETECFYEQEEQASLKAFAELIKKSSKGKGIITFYQGGLKTEESLLPKQYLKRLEKEMIANGVDASRLILVNGGKKKGQEYSWTTHIIRLQFSP